MQWIPLPFPGFSQSLLFSLSPPCPRVIACPQRRKSSHSPWLILSWRKKLTVGIPLQSRTAATESLSGCAKMNTGGKPLSLIEQTKKVIAHSAQDNESWSAWMILLQDSLTLLLKHTTGIQLLRLMEPLIKNLGFVNLDTSGMPPFWVELRAMVVPTAQIIRFFPDSMIC